MAAAGATVGSFTFIGNATALKRWGSLKEPARRVDQLPSLDGVVLSHLHGDRVGACSR